MFDGMIRDVQGTWKTDGMGKRYIDLRWIDAGGEAHFTGFFEGSVAALSMWLATQPKEPTAAEIAARLVERWDRNTDLAEMAWGEKLADLERHIAAVIEAERAQEDA